MTLVEHITSAIEPGMDEEEAAIATFSELVDAAVDAGQDPKAEVLIKDPTQAQAHGVGKAWWVSWEGGPYMWATGLTLQLTVQTGRLVETHYGFDLLFWPEEA